MMHADNNNTPASQGAHVKTSRRDFLALGIVTVGTAVVLTTIPKPIFNPIRWDRKLPDVLPITFRRFILTRRAPLSGEQYVETIAYGTQYPNYRCLVQMTGESILQEYSNVAAVANEFVNNITKLIWLDNY